MQIPSPTICPVKDVMLTLVPGATGVTVQLMVSPLVQAVCNSACPSFPDPTNLLVSTRYTLLGNPWGDNAASTSTTMSTLTTPMCHLPVCVWRGGESSSDEEVRRAHGPDTPLAVSAVAEHRAAVERGRIVVQVDGRLDAVRERAPAGLGAGLERPAHRNLDRRREAILAVDGNGEADLVRAGVIARAHAHLERQGLDVTQGGMRLRQGVGLGAVEPHRLEVRYRRVAARVLGICTHGCSPLSWPH